MTPEEIAEVRPRLARSDQRVAGGLYVRGLLTDGRRKSMAPMAGRLGADHQRLQQFSTSSTGDYAAGRANVARWFAASLPVGALVVDDTGYGDNALFREGWPPPAGGMWSRSKAPPAPTRTRPFPGPGRMAGGASRP